MVKMLMDHKQLTEQFMKELTRIPFIPNGLGKLCIPSHLYDARQAIQHHSNHPH